MGKQRRGVTEFLQAFQDFGVTFFDLETDLLVTLAGNGSISRVNPAFERVLGYREPDILGSPLIQYVDITDMASFIRAFYNRDTDQPFRLLHRWTGVITVRLVAYRFREERGEKRGFVILREVKA